MVREFPEQEKRVECGAIQFGDDWPGLFLRGDSAIAFGMYLKMFLAMGHKAGLPQHFGGNIQWVIDLIDNEVNLTTTTVDKDA